MKKLTFDLAVKLNFLVALMATLGSLYFSEILMYPPCILCWYQRICMYPLVLIFGSSLWTGDRNVFRYSSPLVLIGLVISVYHVLLQKGIVPKDITPCQQGVSCATQFINWLGFITIPVLSMTAFLIITGITLSIFKRGVSNEEQ